MKQDCTRALWSAAVALMLTGAAMAATPIGGSHGKLSAADKKFLIKAAQGGAGEVSLGKVAESHAASSGVKQFGARMVSDHSKANLQLIHVAAQEHVTVPKSPGPEEKATQAKLSPLHGASFDRAYISDMIKDHKMDIADFQKEASAGKDPAVKSFAAKTLPTLKMHLQMVEALAKSSAGSKSMSVDASSHKM